MSLEAVGSMTYTAIKEKNEKLQTEYLTQQNELAKQGVKWEEMADKLRPIKEEIWLNEKRMRLAKAPALSFGKKWKGKTYTLEEFFKMSKSGKITDNDGYGFYATELGKSDIEIYPSDVLTDMVRTDFPNVIWFETEKG